MGWGRGGNEGGEGREVLGEEFVDLFFGGVKGSRWYL